MHEWLPAVDALVAPVGEENVVVVIVGIVLIVVMVEVMEVKDVMMVTEVMEVIVRKVTMPVVE